MKLFVGLGNPGAGYARHRHNVGFMALDAIATRHGFGPWRRKFSGLTSDGAIDGVKVALLKPETFMNDSGRAVGDAVRFHKLEIGDVVVFHDELDLAPGKLRVKTGGGNAGHNGLRSITALVGNETRRVRIGIGHPGAKELVHAYVLHDFAKADHAWLGLLLDVIAEHAGRLADGDAERFQTDCARALQPAPADGKAGVARAKADVEPAKPARHPAGERAGKQQSAIADNLKKWMAARRRDD